MLTEAECPQCVENETNFFLPSCRKQIFPTVELCTQALRHSGTHSQSLLNREISRLPLL